MSSSSVITKLDKQETPFILKNNSLEFLYQTFFFKLLWFRPWHMSPFHWLLLHFDVLIWNLGFISHNNTIKQFTFILVTLQNLCATTTRFWLCVLAFILHTNFYTPIFQSKLQNYRSWNIKDNCDMSFTNFVVNFFNQFFSVQWFPNTTLSIVNVQSPFSK